MARRRNNGLTIKERAFVKNMSDTSKNLTQGESARLAGYSSKSADSIASQLLTKGKIIKALEDNGLTDDALAKGLKVNFEEGIGVKATADTSLKATEMILKLKGYLGKEEATTVNNNTMLVNELYNLSDIQLQERLNRLQEVTGTSTTIQ